MVSTSVLLVAVVSSYALIAGAFYALVNSIAHRIDGIDLRMRNLESEVAGLKAGVAVLESRLEH